MPGTKADVSVVRVVDGDTLRVQRNGTEESLRILSLDTEESHAGGSKPVTPLGHKAKAEAQRMFGAGDTVTIEFPGDEPIDVCWEKYRGNFGRPLVYVYRGDEDFQEHMIRTGLSPYFNKYGHALFEENHQRYVDAERHAQIEHTGIWDQATENGSEMRNYAALGTWWNLRAEVIDDYRTFNEDHRGAVLSTRNDYDELLQKAANGEDITIFTELREFRRVGGDNALIGIGSIHKPFDVFIPDIEDAAGQSVLNLLLNRFIATDVEHPRRSYAYVTGALSMFRGIRPQITVTGTAQVSIDPPAAPAG